MESYGYNPNDFIEYDSTTKYVGEDVITVMVEMTGEHSYQSQAGWDIPFLVCSQVHLNKKGSPIIKIVSHNFFERREVIITSVLIF